MDFVDVGFDAIAPNIISPIEAPNDVFGPPKKCRHPHCGKQLEKLFNTWVHIDGSRKCAPTYAEPEEGAE